MPVLFCSAEDISDRKEEKSVIPERLGAVSITRNSRQFIGKKGTTEKGT